MVLAEPESRLGAVGCGTRSGGVLAEPEAAGPPGGRRWLTRGAVAVLFQSANLFHVMDNSFDLEGLASLSTPERRKLLRALVALEQQDAPTPGTSWKWDAVLVVIVASCILLAAWIGVLAVTLPRFYHTGSWRGAWVGFDIALLAAFAATGWAAWRRRQLLIISLVVLATLLLCDAWFDVVLDVQTAGFIPSLLSALLVELPLAMLAILMARRLLKLTFGQIMRYEGLSQPVPPLWQIPLLGPTAGTPLTRLIEERARRKAVLARRRRPTDLPPATSEVPVRDEPPPR